MDTEPQLYSPPLTHWAMPRCVCAQLCLTLCHPMDCSLPGFSLPGIFQARILEWVAISSSRGSPQTRGQSAGSCVSYLARQLLYHWATWEAHFPNQTISSSHLLEHILPLSFLPPSRELPSFWLFLWMVSSFSGLNFNVFHELRSLFTNLHRSHPLFAITTPVYFFPHLTNLFWVQVCGKKSSKSCGYSSEPNRQKKKKNVCLPEAVILVGEADRVVFVVAGVQSLSHVWLCDPMDCNTPGFPVLHSPRACSNSHPLSWWCHPAISFFPLLLLPSKFIKYSPEFQDIYSFKGARPRWAYLHWHKEAKQIMCYIRVCLSSLK